MLVSQILELGLAPASTEQALGGRFQKVLVTGAGAVVCGVWWVGMGGGAGTRGFVVKGLEQRAEAVALGADVGVALVAGDVWGYEVAAGAEVFGLGVSGARCVAGAGRLGHDVAQHGEEIVGAGGLLRTGPAVAFGSSRGHDEAVVEGLAVADLSAGGWGRATGLHAQEVNLDPFDALVQVLQTGCFCLVVAVGDEAVDLALVLVEEGVDVGLVDKDAALLAGQHEVEVAEQANPRVKGHPAEDGV